MSLASGRELHSYQWDVLPVGEDVINRVHELAIMEEQSKIDANFMYEWNIGGGAAFHDDEEDDTNDDIEDLLRNDVAAVTDLLTDTDDEDSEEEAESVGEEETDEGDEPHEQDEETENEVNVEVGGIPEGDVGDNDNMEAAEHTNGDEEEITEDVQVGEGDDEAMNVLA